jgi:hypothetical protein
MSYPATFFAFFTFLLKFRNPGPGIHLYTVAEGKSAKRGRHHQPPTKSATMYSTEIQSLEHLSAFPPTLRRMTRTVAGNARTVRDKSKPEPRLWKLTSTVASPLERGIETGLFLIVSSLGLGVTINSVCQFVTFFHNDSLTQTVSALLR